MVREIKATPPKRQAGRVKGDLIRVKGNMVMVKDNLTTVKTMRIGEIQYD